MRNLKYIALALVLVLCPLLRRAKDSPALMRGILLAMLLLAGGYLAFVSLYPFPADVDAANLASGTKNAYTMLGCMLGVWATYEADSRWTRFDTKAPLLGQIGKLALGLGLLLRSGSALLETVGSGAVFGSVLITLRLLSLLACLVLDVRAASFDGLVPFLAHPVIELLSEYGVAARLLLKVFLDDLFKWCHSLCLLGVVRYCASR